MTDRIQLLAQGDLHTPVPDIRSGDETGILAKAAEQTILGLRDVFSDITGNLAKMSEGDLTGEAAKQYPGDFAPIQDSLHRILEAMNHIFLQFRRSTEQVSNSAEQVAAASQGLSQGASEQASSAE